MKFVLATLLTLATGLAYATEHTKKKEEMKLPAKQKAEATGSTKKVENSKK